MKLVLISSSPQTVHIVMSSMRARWPDVSPLVATTMSAGLGLVEQGLPNVILLRPDFTDAPLPEALHRLRLLSTIPLMVLSNRGDEMEAVTALELGADDYVRLPCEPTELTVRVWALLRRVSKTYSQGEGPLVSGPLIIDPNTQEVFLEERRLTLTATEFRLLHLLVRHRGTVVSHRMLEQSLRDGLAGSPGLVKKHVQRLRRKLGDDAREPRWVANVHGLGYRFIGPGHDPSEPKEPLYAATA